MPGTARGGEPRTPASASAPQRRKAHRAPARAPAATLSELPVGRSPVPPLPDARLNTEPQTRITGEHGVVSTVALHIQLGLDWMRP